MISDHACNLACNLACTRHDGLPRLFLLGAAEALDLVAITPYCAGLHRLNLLGPSYLPQLLEVAQDLDP